MSTALHFSLGAAVAIPVTLLRISAVGARVAAADGLFVSGALLLSVYALRFANAEGGFDVFSYAIRALFGRARPSDYAAYRKRGRKAPPRSLFLAGLILILGALPLSLLC